MRWTGYLLGRDRDGGFVLCGAKVAQGGVPPAGVVPALDVVEERAGGGFAGRPGAAVDEVVLHVAKKDSATALSPHYPASRRRAGALARSMRSQLRNRRSCSSWLRTRSARVLSAARRVSISSVIAVIAVIGSAGACLWCSTMARSAVLR